jgi:hypothetical protein
MRKIFFLIFLLCPLIHNVYAQPKSSGSSAEPQPQFLNHIYFLQQDSLIALEQVSAEMKSKTKALGFGGNETGYEMNGEKSPVRIKNVAGMRFAVKLNTAMFDPSTMIKLYKFDSQKSGREAIVGAQGGMFNKKKNSGGANEIACNVQKSGNDVYIIIPALKLEKGEYGFVNMMMVSTNGMRATYTVFAFGVDE